MLVKTDIVAVDRSTKWGYVVVADETGAILRELEITAAEAEAVRDGNGAPPGIALALWQTGRVFSCTRPCRERQALIEPDGWLLVNWRIDRSTPDRLPVSLMRIPPGDWELRGQDIWIESSIAQQIGPQQ